MDLVHLPTPAVHKVLSFLDAEDALNYLLVVSADNIASFSLPRFRIHRRYHQDSNMAELLLRFARRSHHIIIKAPIVSLQPSMVIRLCCQFSHVHHLDIRGFPISENDLHKLYPVISRVETLKYQIVHSDKSPTAKLTPVEDHYSCLKDLHIVLKFDLSKWKFEDYSWAFPPGRTKKLELTSLAISSQTAAFHDFELLRHLMPQVEPTTLRELRLSVVDREFIFLLFNCLKTFPNLALVSLKADFKKYYHDGLNIKVTIERAISRDCFSVRHPVRFHLKQNRAEVCQKMNRKPLMTEDEKVDFLFSIGNRISFLLHCDAVDEWSLSKAQPTVTKLEVGPHSLPLIGDLDATALSHVSCVTLYLDELDSVQLTNEIEIEGLQPTTLKLLLRKPLRKEERVRVIEKTLEIISDFRHLDQVFVYGLNFFSYEDLNRIFDVLFPTVIKLHLFHSASYVWSVNSSIVRLPASIRRLSKLQMLTIGCSETCWDTQVISLDRLLPVLGEMESFRRLLLHCPGIRHLMEKESSFHHLMKSRPTLEEVTMVLPNLPSSTAHLIMKRLRNTASMANEVYAKRMIFRILPDLDDVRENRPLSEFLIHYNL